MALTPQEATELYTTATQGHPKEQRNAANILEIQNPGVADLIKVYKALEQHTKETDKHINLSGNSD